MLLMLEGWRWGGGGRDSNSGVVGTGFGSRYFRDVSGFSSEKRMLLRALDLILQQRPLYSLKYQTGTSGVYEASCFSRKGPANLMEHSRNQRLIFNLRLG